MQVRHIALETARAYLAEGDAGAVVGVDVGRNFEDEARKLFLVRLHQTFLSQRGTRCGGYLHKAIEEFLAEE